ncbi:protein transport protein Sec24C-like isoform X1 [Carcharodon carcharias]|uniref:protein transport protein Sec24C-like isoform X1 n=1 Tax=Carcharodon carcharias TaxID=13397 RepID=UPI001B7EC6B1|nr:protein transport protein Sec24C-like isoform X1 [Carcharodon carcharias]XP_041065091.1 protein transport protein Sec24C-like isoform X1 [Carcharodon carcharias]
MDGLEIQPSQPCSSGLYSQSYERQPPGLPSAVSWSSPGPSSFGTSQTALHHDWTPITSPLCCPSALPSPAHPHHSTTFISNSSRPTVHHHTQQQNSTFQPVHHGYPRQPDALQNPNTLYSPLYPGVVQETVHSVSAASHLQGSKLGLLEDSGHGINPDLIPNPVQVAEDDRVLWESQLFCTDTRGQVPPLTTTHFTVVDQGIASPRFVRCTMYTFPCSQELAKLSHLPLAAVVKPLATLPEEEAPVRLVDHGEAGPIRCERCAAYMCPLMHFLDNGQRFQCPFCDAVSQVPQHYFHPIDYSGKRADRPTRPELSQGSYEFLMPEEPCKHNRGQSSVGFIFMIDVSYNAVRSGLLSLICAELKQVVQYLSRECGAEETAVRVGLITYDKVLHLYNVKNTLIQPQMVVITDVSDLAMPPLDGLLVNAKESEALINSLLDKIPLLFADSLEADVLFGPVVQAGLEALKAADCPGKLFIFHTSLPTTKAPGALRNRSDHGIINTNKEQILFQPQGSYYQELAEQCVQQGCCVDLFLFPSQYVDVASLGLLTFRTGGDLYYYSNFRADRDAEQFQVDLRRDVQKVIGFKAVLKVHTQKGIRATNYLGSLHMKNRTEVQLAAIDSNKTLLVEFKHNGKLSEEDGVHIQFELFYSTVSGQRRLRIHNVSLNCSSQLTETFRSSQAETLLNYFAKTAYDAVPNHATKSVQDKLVSHITRMLAAYRKYCAHSSPNRGQLVMPQFLKIFPLYLNCLRKSKVLLPGADVSIDERAYIRQLVMSMDITETNVLFYPCLLPMHELNGNVVTVPRAVRCLANRLSPEGFYLLEDGLSLFLWIGMLVPAEWIQNVFGAPSFNAVDCGVGSLPVLDNPFSRQIRNMISSIRKQRARFLKLIIVKQADRSESQFRQFLVEDKSPSGGASYPDFLRHLHIGIQQALK